MLTPVGIPIPGMHVYTYLTHQCIELGDEVSLHPGQIVLNGFFLHACSFTSSLLPSGLCCCIVFGVLPPPTVNQWNSMKQQECSSLCHPCACALKNVAELLSD